MTAALEARLNASVFKHLANAAAIVGGATVRGVFRNGFMLADGGVGMGTTNPVFTCATAELPAAPVGETLALGSSTYVIAAHEPDGTGVSVLMLERVG
jgi:hypothetical protein